MEAMATYSAAAMTAAPVFDPRYFVEFVEWIDRSEKTARTYLVNLRQFWAFLLYRAVKQPQRVDFVNYRNWLLSEHDSIQLDPEAPQGWTYRTDRNGDRVQITCKPNTARAYLRSVCQFFKWTASAGLYPNIAENIHAPKVRQDAHKKDALTASEVLDVEQSILARASKKERQARHSHKDTAGRVQRSTEQGRRLYAIYLLAVTAGLRTVEIHRANVRDFEEKNGAAWLYIYGKGHTEADQKKALAPEVAEAIRDYLDSRTDQYTGSSPLFVSTGNRSGGKRIATTTVSTMLKKAMQEAGYNSERLTAHSLRHTAGTAVMEMTGDLYRTQQYMRHSNPATTEIYLHVNTDPQDAETARDLYAYYHADAQPADARNYPDR